ncbi:hypothetical protein BHF71_04030 [Vulcanibacillus modesticaldus]|uniref:TRAP C4-dicarboxylate transport system permease DctM subunit domain-containing protein n=1 Tax=Vulcanibacillus modesticaldus TaxID=337097 RepID=A0A1D2YS85_9BACI|nr:TRAP transporter permease [Vulcanibacillus modesticaldus]OEF96904.1 hypothetical protein BHF71_04030 [Vulcanibacillus modesticaldus]
MSQKIDEILEKIIDEKTEQDIVEAEEATEHILEEMDAGYNYRKNLPFYWRWFVFAAAVLLSLFQLYTAIYGTLPSNQQRGFHVAIAMGLIFLLYPGTKKNQIKVTLGSWFYSGLLMLITIFLFVIGEIRLLTMIGALLILLMLQLSKYYNRDYLGIPFSDLVLSFFGFATGLYQFFAYEGIIARVGMYSDIDYLVAATGVLVVLGATKRVIGTPIVAVAAIMLAYAYLGPYIPFSVFEHRGFSIERIISHSFLSTEGIFGIPVSISATFIFLYLMFGVILRKTGLEEYFTDLAVAMTGWMTGGTAKVGILTSVFSGMITGSSVANTVGNGAFTIPMMKRSGYKPEFAAAVEAASSTGGQITPPIMGSAAFLMIEFTGLPYNEIIKAAIIPALLFFTAQFFVIHYESKRLNIMGLPREELPKVSHLLITKGYLLIPIIMIFVILALGLSAMRAALWGIFTAVIMNLLVMVVAFILGKYNKLKYRINIKVIFEILEESTRTALPIIAAVATAGIISGVITLTGLGLKIAGAILTLANHKLLLTMFFAMIASIILGMGLPTTANYVIMATMTAPALLEFGTVPVIAAHMFVFYFGIIADITPPVALASYAGAGIAKSDPFKTGIESVRIAIGGFLVPYLFVLSPELLLIATDSSIISLLLAIATAFIGMYGIGTAVIGFIEKKLTFIERILLLAAGLGLVYANWTFDLFGLLVVGTIFIYQKFSTRETVTLSQ